MMHHSNMHGSGGGGGGPHSGPPPPPGPTPMHRHQMHQPMTHQHHQSPHHMHHDNRHPMGLSQPSSMSNVGQSMGGMGQPMAVPQMHPARPPHQIRPITHHAPPTQHHNMPPMKTMRRPYHMGGSYSAAPCTAPAYPQQPPSQPPAVMHHAPPPPPVEVSAEGGASVPTEACEAAPPVGAVAGDGSGAQGGGEAIRPPAVPPAINPLANSKEKTPMCLVNELARFNKIKHQYRLTSETGPAHKKIFTVTLRLGENEEYTAEGSSIKRAQHAAASAALSQTQYTFPPAKLHSHTPSHAPSRYTGAVMPTVELNALAMKLCKPAVYTQVPPVPVPPPPLPGARFPRFRPPYPPYPPRFHPPHPPHPPPYPPPYAQRNMGGVAREPGPVYRVRVSVGERSWPGEGPTPQAARHDAAARALLELRDQLPPETTATDTQDQAALATIMENAMDIKSPVSLVHELALKKGLTVVFNVKSERGPPHMRVFVTTCTVGELEVEGEGNGKKASKKRAAELMVQEMRDKWPFVVLNERLRLQHQQRARRKQLVPKKKSRNLIKENGEASSEQQAADSADNPISRLAIACHAQRSRSPQYTVLEEGGAPRRRVFKVQCDASPHRGVGVGPNKKAAKRRAAQNVLISMGLSTESSSPDLGTKQTPSTTDKPHKPEHIHRPEGEEPGPVRQPAPGVLLVSDYAHRPQGHAPAPQNGISETAATGGGSAESGVAVTPGVAPGAKDQLIYLSQLLGFNVQFSDFPKRNHGEFLSLVALSTVPPVMCHGGGASTLQSHEQCSRAALRALASMGLDPQPRDSAQSPPNTNTKTGGGLLSNGIND